MSAIKLEVNGDTEKLMKQLKKLQHIDKKGISTAMAEALRESTVSRFEAEQTPDGGQWKKSIRASSGGKTLTQTARLKNSIHAKAEEEGFAVGTNTIYAATHQFGAQRTIRAKSGGMLKFKVNGVWRQAKEVTINVPARPFLGMSDQDQQEIQGILEYAMAE